MKLFGISLGALLVSAITWGILWFWSQSLTYKPYDHPLLNWSSQDGSPSLALAAENPLIAAEFLKENPQGILILNVRISSDAQLFTADSISHKQLSKAVSELSERNPSSYKGNKFFYYPFPELQKMSSGIVRIEEWLSLKPRFWIFNVIDNATDIDKNLTLWIEKHQFQNQVVTFSEADVVVSSIKDQRPLWIYGTSQSDLAKLLTMASVGLQGLVNVRRDFLIAPVRWKDRDVLNLKVVREMQRRFKKVAIGPVHTDFDRERALSFKPDILILGSFSPKK